MYNTLIKSTASYSPCSTDITFMLLLNDNRIALSSKDSNNIMLYTKEHFAFELSLEGHKDTVIYITQLEDNRLVSSSSDKTVIIWELYKSSYVLKHIIGDIKFQLHTITIEQILQVDKKRMVLAGDDFRIMIYSTEEPYNMIKVIKPSSRYVVGVVYNDNRLYSFSKDDTMRVWNMKSYQCESVLCNIACDIVYQIDKERIMIGENGIIKIISMKDVKVIYTLKNNLLKNIVSMCEVKENVFIFGFCCGKIIKKGGVRIMNIKRNKVIDLIDDVIFTDIIKIDEEDKIITVNDYGFSIKGGIKKEEHMYYLPKIQIWSIQ